MTEPLWPRYAGPVDLASVEAVPLDERDLPASVVEIVRRASLDLPAVPAHLTLTSGAAWDAPVPCTHGALLAEVIGTANAFAAR